MRRRCDWGLGMSEWRETELGRIPKHWEVYDVNEIKSPYKKSIISGPFGSNISAKYFVEDGIPVIRGNNLSLTLTERFKDDGFVYITEEKANELNTWAKLNDIVFTAVGTIGQVGIILNNQKFKKYIISNKQLRLTVDENIVLPLFAYYWFASPTMIDIIIQRNTGSSVPLINLSVLKSLNIPVPPLPEQKAIAEVLSSLDDKIDLLHRQNKTLEQMAETLFRQWFVEEAGEDWEDVTISQFVNLNSKSITKEYPITNIEYLDTGSLTEGNFDAFQSYRLEDAPSRAKRLVQHNDVLISTVRPNQKHYGIVKNPIENLVVSTGFCVVTCEDIDPHFIYFLLTNDRMTEYLHSIAEGSTSTYPSLKPIDIGAVEFKLPPAGLMSEFAEFAHDAWEKIQMNYCHIGILRNLRESLLPKLMCGEVRISNNG